MSTAVESYVATATEFCTFIEGAERYSTGQFIHRARHLIPTIYLAALSLPHVETTDAETARDITGEQWDCTFKTLQKKLAEYDYYWEIFNPGEFEPEPPVSTLISDDLADMWRDSKAGLIHWDGASDTLRQQIVWDWRFSFHNHWSAHAVDALRTIDWAIGYHQIADA